MLVELLIIIEEWNAAHMVSKSGTQSDINGHPSEGSPLPAKTAYAVELSRPSKK
jgi:hypothetical protein